MATNPMQRKARTSFIMGVLITLVLAAVVIGYLFTQLRAINQKNKDMEADMVEVYVLAADVNSGDVLTSDMFKKSSTMKSTIPADYAEVTKLLDAYSLYTKDGKAIKSTVKDNVQHLYIEGDENQEVIREETTGKYYLKSSNKNERQYIDTAEAPVIAKIAAKRNTVISTSLIARSNEVDTDDVREQEYNMLVLPTDLMNGDFIDVRLQLPNGQDFIVVSKKRISIPDVSGEYLADTIQMKMSEQDTVTMSNAIVEAYRIEGAKLYVAKYTEAGFQESAIPTYIVNEDIAKLVQSNPNIVNEAKSALITRYNSNASLVRNQINNSITNNGNDENIKQKMEESITSTKETRQRYLQSLSIPQTSTAQ